MDHPSFALTLSWSGDTTDTVPDKDAVARTAGKPDLEMSSGAGDGANAARWNPEDLLGASLAQCYMLTFLALAKKVKLSVVAYEDDVTVDLVTEGRATRVGTITLEPTITLSPGDDADKAEKMFHKAEKYCYISNSLNSEVVGKPTFVFADS